MAEFSFEDAVVPQAKAEPVADKYFSFDEAAKPESKPELPMPGIFEAGWKGLKTGAQQVLQSGEVLGGEKQPVPIEETGPEAQPWEWSDVLSPVARGLPKAAYQLSKTAPLPVALGAGAAAAGTYAAGPPGALAGGASGAAVGAAIQAIGPAFAEELKKNPKDPEGAWTRAMESAAVSGAGTGASWALLPLRIPGVASAVKNAAFQLFGVQPGVAVATDVAQHAVKGEPITAKDVGQSYASGVVATAIPAIGHMALTKPSVAPPAAGPISKGGLTDWYNKTFQPELVSDKALQADPQFAKYKSASAQERDAIVNRAEENYYKWNQVPEENKLDFLSAYEMGSGAFPDPWMQERAQTYRKLLKQAYEDEAMYGSKAGYIDEYFPHLWEKPDVAAAKLQEMALPQNLGPKWFQNARYYDLIEEGMRAGLKLKTTNPEELVTMRLLSGADMRMRMELLQNLQAMGLAVPTKEAPTSIRNKLFSNTEPWQAINAPNREQWMIAPDVQPMWENAVNAKGLWADTGAAGNIFRGWMALKNAWVPIRLGLSLFHPVHVVGINLSNNLARAVNETFSPGQQSLLRRTVAIPEALVQSVFDNVLALPIGTPFRGKTGREAWLTPKSEQTPEQRARTDLYNEGGFSPQLSEQLRIAAKRKLSDAINNNQYLRASGHAARRLLEIVQSPIFEKWIPNLKAAAFDREAEALFRRRPDLLNDPMNRAIALRAIGKQVDNRFGEMFYGGLFWDRTVKDAAIGSFLSLGWNLGFAREFVGGALEPIARRLVSAPTPTRKLIRETTSKTTNAFLYAMTSMMGAGAINYAFTGEMPQGWDYIFPRIGGNNPDGSPRRVTTPFYTREVPMAQKNIDDQQSLVGGLAQMLQHKLMFSPFLEAWNNKDYFGYQMRDPNSPAWKQTHQIVSNILSEQLNPMSITGAKRALELSGKPHTTLDVLKNAGSQDVYMPMLGFPPAPAYASRTPIQNRIAHLYQTQVMPSEKPFAEKEQYTKRREARDKYLLARQSGDTEKITEAAKELAATGVKPSSMAKLKPGTQDIGMFYRLPKDSQIAILKESSPEEFKRYWSRAKLDAKRDPDIVKLRKYYGG